MRTRIAAAAIGAAALLTISACSSSSDNAAPPATSPAATSPAGPAPTATPQDDAKADLTKSVEDYTAEMFGGDPAGYNLMSARCRKQMTRSEWIQLVSTAHQQYGSQKATNIHIDQLSGDLARVSYGAGNIPQFDRQAQPWAREDGTWRWDACQTTS